MVDESWQHEMNDLLTCLGESPDRIEGAWTALAHLAWFVEQCHNHCREHHPDEHVTAQVVSAGVVGWLNAARESLIPFRPEGATDHVNE